jgi:hypothetical protein
MILGFPSSFALWQAVPLGAVIPVVPLVAGVPIVPLIPPLLFRISASYFEKWLRRVVRYGLTLLQLSCCAFGLPDLKICEIIRALEDVDGLSFGDSVDGEIFEASLTEAALAGAGPCPAAARSS